MRKDPAGSRLTARQREPRIVIGIIYPFGSIYVTNRANAIANVPGNVVHGALQDVQASSQELYPVEARATIGGLSFAAVDLGGALTAEFREQLADFDNGIGRREIRVFSGDTDNFTDGTWPRVETYVIDSSVEYDRGSYAFSCSDIQRELRERIFTHATTRLGADLAVDGATLTVLSTDGFDMLQHTAAFSDAPSENVGYLRLKKTGEVVRYTGKTETTFTGCTRGVFNTRAQAVDVDEASQQDRWPEVEEVIYLEMPAVQMAYAVMTGNILDTSIQLPEAWHLGIAPSLVDADMFREIGTDLYDPANHAAGFILQFSSHRGLKETDGKRFIEEQLHLPMNTFCQISAEGRLGLRRFVRTLSDAAPHAIVFNDNIVDFGALVHSTADVVNRVIIRWNHDGEGFARDSVLVNNRSIAAHGVGRTIELDLLGLTVQRHTVQTIRRIFNAIVDRYGSPPQHLELQLSPSLNRLEVGDIVRVVIDGVRDFAGLAHLDRSFEIQGRQMNWRTGALNVRLFGSTQAVSPDDGDGETPPLSDEWYESEGVPLSSVLTIVGNHVTANGNLPGHADLRQAVYYHLDDLTIDAAVALTTNLNVQLRIRGALTVNGAINGMGRGAAAITNDAVVGDPPGTLAVGTTVQTFGSTQGSAGLVWTPPAFARTFPSPLYSGIAAVARPALEVHAGVLEGIPATLMGTPGVYGNLVLEGSWPSYTVRALGGAGGASGAGLMIVSRAPLSFGASGVINLSGANGAAGETVTLVGRQYTAGAGGGGAPGCLLTLNDGDDIPLPDLTNGFVAMQGATPQAGNPISQMPPDEAADPITGAGAGIGSLDLWGSAHLSIYVPHDEQLGDSADEETPAPRSLTAVSDASGVQLSWELPAASRFDFIELFESIDNDRANATLLYRGAASSFFRTSETEISRYYWIRARDDIRGPSAWFPISPTDGVASTFGGGIEGAPGVDAVSVSITAPDGVQWRQAVNNGAWSPTGTTTDITFTFLQAGSTIATRVLRVTRTGAALTVSLEDATGDATSHTVVGSGTSVVTLIVTHTDSGVSGAQSVSAVVSGTDGAPGTPGTDGDDGEDGEDGADGEDYWTPTLSPNITRAGKSFAKVASDGAWDSGFYSLERYGACVAAFSPAQTNLHFMIGLNTDSAADHNYTSIDHALFCLGDATLAIYNNGVSAGAFGSYAAGDALSVQYDGHHVRYVKNGAVLHTVSDPGKFFSLDSSFYNVGATANNVSFAVAPGGQVSLDTQISGTLTTAFAAAGLINSNVTINADGTLSAAGGGQASLNALPGQVQIGSLAANVVTAAEIAALAVTAGKINVATIAAINADLGAITAGTIVLSASGHVRAGMSAFDTGTGFFLGIESSAPKFSVGNSGGDKLTFDGTTLVVRGHVDIDQAETAFGGLSWDSGWSSAPTGDMYYRRSGDIVFVRCDASCFGTSNSGVFAFSAWPIAIRPAATRSFAVTVYNGGTLQPATLSINSDGSCGCVVYTGAVNNFSGSGNKGFPPGTTFQYSM